MCREERRTPAYVVAVTADPDNSTCREFGIDQCLPKPLASAQIVDLLREHWRRRSPTQRALVGPATLHGGGGAPHEGAAPGWGVRMAGTVPPTVPNAAPNAVNKSVSPSCSAAASALPPSSAAVPVPTSSVRRPAPGAPVPPPLPPHLVAREDLQPSHGPVRGADASATAAAPPPLLELPPHLSTVAPPLSAPPDAAEAGACDHGSQPQSPVPVDISSPGVDAAAHRLADAQPLFSM